MLHRLLKTNFGLCLLAVLPLWAQTGYNNHAQLSVRLKALSTKYNATASVRSVGKSSGGRDLWLLTLSKGDASKKPAVLIVAGIEGSHLAGTELAVQMAEKMLASNNDTIAKLLDTKTFYFLPSVNPDAQEQFFSKLKYERSGNDTKTDDDRDGRIDEDPFEDLNGDGLITLIRVEDPTGSYVASKEDPRVMVKADGSKGETGKYLLLTEGSDNDQDGQYNEDGVGGIIPDKNFTFDYQIFTTGGGEYAAEAVEVRALLDFLYKSPNIFAVLTFGPHNNLSEAPKFEKEKASKKIISGPLQKDINAMQQVSKLYNAATGLKDAPKMPQTRGNFAQTAYYHAGRFSFTTPGWWVPKIAPAKDTTQKDSTRPKADEVPKAEGETGRAAGMGAAAGADATPKPGEEEIRFLKWADKEKIPNAFVAWTAIKHPDFPDQKVEVGGITPFAKLNPPVSYLEPIADKHLTFLKGLGQQMPQIQLVKLKTENLGAGLNRISVTVVNKGLLPTYTEIGDKVRFVQKVKTELKLANGQAIVSGKRLNLHPTLGADESEEYSWLISGTGKLTIEASCPTAGNSSLEVTLK
ncbi:MAG: M14 family metallopeptidase [Runella sp.]